jgi:aryl-alcohol dehydrogenase-like predicted oxidoreductase
VGQIAAARGVPRAQVALAWLLQEPAVVAPIIGATKLQHLTEASDALAVKLSPEEMTAVEEPYLPHPVVEFC